MSNAPQELPKDVEINKLIMGDGVESLPATVVDGKIVMTKCPSNAEIARITWCSKSYLGEEKNQAAVAAVTVEVVVNERL